MAFEIVLGTSVKAPKGSPLHRQAKLVHLGGIPGLDGKGIACGTEVDTSQGVFRPGERAIPDTQPLQHICVCVSIDSDSDEKQQNNSVLGLLAHSKK